MTFNPVDAVLALVVLLGVWGGWRMGFVAATARLATLAISLALAFLTYRIPASRLEVHLPWLGVWTAPLAFLAVYLAYELIFGAIARWIVNAAPRAVHLHAGNRLLGLAPGLALGLVHAMVLAMIVPAVPLSDRLSQWVRDSELAVRLTGPGEWVESHLAPIFEPAVRRTLQGLTVPPGPRATIELPYNVATAKDRPELEAGMLALVNAERAREGLRPLKADPEIAEVARAHSRDMFARGYFSHQSADGRELTERLRQRNVRYLVAGENLAHAQTLERAHRGLMESPGHRANILRAQFGRAGIAVIDGGKYGLMITQNFRN